jgi:DNA-binding transcriptional ArsR family regulator
MDSENCGQRKLTAAPTLDRIFGALADPTRRAIVARLTAGQATVGELAAPFAISLPAISRHLKVLERASLINRIADGPHRWCRLNPAGLSAAADWLAFHQGFWDASFDRLEAELRRPRVHPRQEKSDSRSR